MKRELQALLDQNFDLSNEGIGLIDRKNATQAKLEKSRKVLLASDPELFKQLYKWCDKQKRIKSFNERYNSTYLKHVVEQRAGEYVSSGLLIAAMLYVGFKMKRIKGSTTVLFNIGVSRRR